MPKTKCASCEQISRADFMASVGLSIGERSLSAATHISTLSRRSLSASLSWPRVIGGNRLFEGDAAWALSCALGSRMPGGGPKACAGGTTA